MLVYVTLLIDCQSVYSKNNATTPSILGNENSGCGLLIEKGSTKKMPICVIGFINESTHSIWRHVLNSDNAGRIVSRLPLPEAKPMIHGGRMRLGLDSQ